MEVVPVEVVLVKVVPVEVVLVEVVPVEVVHVEVEVVVDHGHGYHLRALCSCGGRPSRSPEFFPL